MTKSPTDLPETSRLAPLSAPARSGEVATNDSTPVIHLRPHAKPAVRTTGRKQPPARITSLDEIEALPLKEMRVTIDRGAGILWCRFAFAGRPSFTPALLDDISRVQSAVVDLHAGAGRSPETGPLRYMVWASDMPGVWNLGGDLRYFAERIRRRDRDGLLTYAHAVVGEGYRNAVNLNLPIVTVSLIQGDALGGGFEAALSSNLLVAEKGSKFGLPEVLFNLFPGMGAYSFLARRISAAYAERLIFSGRIHTAEELHDVGVIDVLTEPGKGVEGFLDHVDRNRDRFNAHRAIYRARQIYHPISRDEMLDIATMWVDTALTLSERDLAKMERLAAAQDKRRARAAAAGLVSPLSA